jgi:hypothetical protein
LGLGATSARLVHEASQFDPELRVLALQAFVLRHQPGDGRPAVVDGPLLLAGT